MTGTAAPAAAPPAAVLWDMDGTLVDTEPYWMACEHALVARFGGTWSDDDARSIIGWDLLDGAAVLRERGGVDLPPEAIVEELLDGVIAMVREHVPWRPGARRLLTELNELGVPCALVTMSWTRLADAVVHALAPISFQAIVTGDAVANGKPHPEPYLTAASLLGVDPQRCVAIEDSPTGAASAGAAGCVVVAVPNVVPIEPAAGRHVVPTLQGLGPGDLGTLVSTTPVVPSTERDAPPGEVPASRAGGRRAAVLAGVGLALVALVVAVLAVRRDDGGGASTPAPAPGPVEVHAWAPSWTLEDAAPSLDEHATTLTELSPFWWRATGVDTIEVDPNASAELTERFLADARERDVPLVASILDGTDAGVMAGILADPAERARHVEAVAVFAADADVAGIDIDYEQFAFADDRGTWATTRPNWVAFVEELAARLRADGRTLTVSIPPVYDDGRTDDSGFWVYDYAGIAPHVDAIRVMAYDYSVASGEPGPIAPLDWVDRVIAGTIAASGDASKLVLGVPLYGYNWVVGTTGTCPSSAEGATSVTNRGVEELASRRAATPAFDPSTGEWAFSYDLVVDDGTTSCTQAREVRYVGADGAEARMRRALDAGYGGVALFALGYDDAATWGAVDAVVAGR